MKAQKRSREAYTINIRGIIDITSAVNIIAMSKLKYQAVPGLSDKVQYQNSADLTLTMTITEAANAHWGDRPESQPNTTSSPTKCPVASQLVVPVAPREGFEV